MVVSQARKPGEHAHGRIPRRREQASRQEREVVMAARRGLGEMGGFVFDLDGCVWTGDVLVPGAADVLALLRRRGRRVSFLTNNSRARASTLSGQARAAGRPGGRPRGAHPARDPGRGHRHPLRSRRACSPSAGPSSSRRRSTAGTRWFPSSSAKAAQVVVVGNDFGFSYERLTAAARAAAGGRPFRHAQHRPAPAARGRRLPAGLRRHRRRRWRRRRACGPSWSASPSPRSSSWRSSGWG